MSGARLIIQLTCVIRLMLEYPQGLSMLIGTVDGPACEDIAEMIETIREPREMLTDPAGRPLSVAGGKRALPPDCMIDNEERFNRIVRRVGGWGHVHAVTRDWRRQYPVSWAVIIDYARWSPEKSRIDNVTLDDIADRHKMSRATFYRIIRRFPQELATAIMNTPIDDEFDLGDVTGVSAV